MSRDEVVVSACFALTFVSSIALAVLYWIGGDPAWEGVLLALCGAGIAVGMAIWAHRLMPRGPFVEERRPLASRPEQRRLFEEDLARGELTRRHVVLGALGAAVVAFGAAMVFPVRSLGPRPSAAELDDTPWDAGRRVVGEDGLPIGVASVAVGSLTTVFPEGAVGSETGQAILVRVAPGLIRPVRGREAWSPDGLLAYSKLCTHAGCPVGLYEAATNELLCPCHQSTFDVLNGARPIFGPAAAPLPQLPLMIDSQGNLRASGGFSSPPGPSFWNRSE